MPRYSAIEPWKPHRFDAALVTIRNKLKDAPQVDVGEWQSMDVSGSKAHVTRELLNVSFAVGIPGTKSELQEMVYGVDQETMSQESQGPWQPDKPELNLNWAEDQFQERVSGKPLNPPPSEAWWPWNINKSNEQHKDQGKFDHTYPERYWPQKAGAERHAFGLGYNVGIRFRYGDLQDVVNLLAKSPYTRQAVLPVWFPEDTGAVNGQRVPCSLGYHFILREGKLHCTYWIRSCDFVRHFKNDFYMTARLLQWVHERLMDTDSAENPFWAEAQVGTLTMHVTSLHVFEGDIRRLDG
jgi:thymidylate synthase